MYLYPCVDYSMVLTTEEDVRKFVEDGVVVLRGVLTEPRLDVVAAAVEENLRCPSEMASQYTTDGKEGGFFGDYCNWRRLKGIRELALESDLPRIAGELTQSKRIQFFHEHVLVKEPWTEEATPLHQDQPYYIVHGEKVVSFWIPMEDIPEEICPGFVVGSHLSGKLYAPVFFKDGVPYEDTEGMVPPPVEFAASARRFRLSRGDIIAFHFRTLHDAPPNLTNNRRRVVSLRYIGDDVVYVDRKHKPSPPYPSMGLKCQPGQPLPPDWFPIAFPRAAEPDKVTP